MLGFVITCRGLISGVIVLLNFVLKYILQLLVEFEKHWTQSDKVSPDISISITYPYNALCIMCSINGLTHVGPQCGCHAAL